MNSKTFVDQSDEQAAPPSEAPERWAWQEGNATEKALVSWLVRYGVNIKEARLLSPAVLSYPFDSVKKCSSVILEVPELNLYASQTTNRMVYYSTYT